MNNKINNKAKRILAGIVAGTLISTGMSGCGKKVQNENDNVVGYSVETSDNLSEIGLYSYIINTKGFESDNYIFSSSNNSINLVKVSDREEYSTNSRKEQTIDFYRDSLKLVWPECFSFYNVESILSNFDIEVKYEKLVDGSSSSPTYIVVYSSITAKNDLVVEDLSSLGDGQQLIKTGDNMASIAIYYDGLVAFKQTGVGSDCENVKEATIGDVDLALSTVFNYGLLEKSESISYEELNEIEKQLNEENKLVKVRK